MVGVAVNLLLNVANLPFQFLGKLFEISGVQLDTVQFHVSQDFSQRPLNVARQLVDFGHFGQFFDLNLIQFGDGGHYFGRASHEIFDRHVIQRIIVIIEFFSRQIAQALGPAQRI